MIYVMWKNADGFPEFSKENAKSQLNGELDFGLDFSNQMTGEEYMR